MINLGCRSLNLGLVGSLTLGLFHWFIGWLVEGHSDTPRSLQE